MRVNNIQDDAATMLVPQITEDTFELWTLPSSPITLEVTPSGKASEQIMAVPLLAARKVQDTLPSMKPMVLESNFEFWTSWPSSYVKKDDPVLNSSKAFDGKTSRISTEAGESITVLEPANIEEVFEFWTAPLAVKPSISLNPALLEPAFELWTAPSVEKVGKTTSGKPSPDIKRRKGLTTDMVQSERCIADSLVPIELSPGFELWSYLASPVAISQKPAPKFSRSRGRPNDVHLVEDYFIPAHLDNVFELWHAAPSTEESLEISASDIDDSSKHPRKLAGCGIRCTGDRDVEQDAAFGYSVHDLEKTLINLEGVMTKKIDDFLSAGLRRRESLRRKR